MRFCPQFHMHKVLLSVQLRHLLPRKCNCTAAKDEVPGQRAPGTETCSVKIPSGQPSQTPDVNTPSPLKPERHIKVT